MHCNAEGLMHVYIFKYISPSIELYFLVFVIVICRGWVSKARDLWDDAGASAKGCCKPDRKDSTALIKLRCIALHCTALQKEKE